MKNLKKISQLLLWITLAGSTNLFSQNATPIVSPTPADDDEVVKITTNLVQVDATVTDKSGKFVGDLTPEDFEVYENGIKRPITGFTFVHGNTGGTISNNLLTSANSSATQISDRNIEQVNRIFAVVIDDLRLSKVGIDYAKKDFKRFIEREVQPNDLVAIIRTSESVSVLQSFTNNKQQLLDALDDLKFHPLTSVGLGSVPPISISFSDAVSGSRSSVALTASAERILANQSNLEVLVKDSINNIAGESGFQTLLTTIKAMGNLKGRKSVIYVSAGYGSGFSNSNGNSTNSVVSERQIGFGNTSLQIEGRAYTVDNVLRVITEEANRNSVTLFPVDPNGAVTTNFSAEDSNRGILGAEGKESISSTQIDTAVRGRSDDIRNDQQSLRYLARETGGKAFINGSNNDNDLKDALDSQSSYYLLAYEPDEKTFDPKSARFNKLEIKVKRSNTNVSYRSGFFNVSNAKTDAVNSEAMTILKKIFIPYNSSEIGIDLANVFAGFENKQATVRAFVNISPKDMTVKDVPDNKKSLKMDVYAVVFDENGRPVGSSAKNYGVTFNAESYDEFTKSGMTTNLSFKIPKAGVYRVKVLIKDDNSGKIGTASQTVLIPDPDDRSYAFSGILLQNFSAAEWQGLQKKTFTPKPEKIQIDTAYRYYKKGTVLTYTYSVNLYPAKKPDTKLNLTMKLVKNGQVIFTGTPEDIPVAGAQAAVKINRGGAFNLGTEMQPGKYTLQITAVGDQSKFAETQSIDFEIVE